MSKLTKVLITSLVRLMVLLIYYHNENMPMQYKVIFEVIKHKKMFYFFYKK